MMLYLRQPTGLICILGNKRMNDKKRNVRKNGSMHAYLFLLPSLTGVLVLFVIPYLDVLRRSFLDGTGQRFVGMDNYKTVVENTSFRLAAGNTVLFLAVCVPLLLFLSLLIAIYLQKNKVIGNWLKSVFLLPMAMPVASIVLLWNVLFTRNGFLSGFLGLLGVAGQNWLNTRYSFAILVFSYIWKNLGYDIVLWLAALATIPSEIYEAARVDGAGEGQCFLHITMPNLWSSLFLILTLSLINGFKVFREAYLVAGDYPEQHIYLLQHLFNNWFRDLAVNKLAAGAVLMGLVLFVLIRSYLTGKRHKEREKDESVSDCNTGFYISSAVCFFFCSSISVDFSAGRFAEEYSGTGKFFSVTLVRRWNDSMDMAAI